MKSLKQYVHKDNTLERLRTSARQLEELARRIRAALPAEAADHIIGCAPRPGTVIVLADTAAWASQLRYLQDRILAACRQQLGESVHSIRFKVLPPEPITGKPPAPQVSESARRLLLGTAGSIDDAELAAALRQLSEPPARSGGNDQDAD